MWDKAMIQVLPINSLNLDQPGTASAVRPQRFALRLTAAPLQQVAMRLNVPAVLLAALLLSTSLAMHLPAQRDVVPSCGSGLSLCEIRGCGHCGGRDHKTSQCPELPLN
ncbi:hypothetical protein PGTUg99_014356 [Puccinia graminis f. sp. tritici]|uniref:Uncharacterized protein n=1 Tax=Puccinia graminis f. sp. tritici TaxID=56615 RepID=A0A5B0NES0_PUCGR|nr:hypothetical protein PGTUg99_014356 [Puccinia graminis f. sp. tritici]